MQQYKSIIPQKNHKGWQIMLGQHLALVTLHCSLQLVSRKTIRIGDTKYHIECSKLIMLSSFWAYSPISSWHMSFGDQSQV